MGRELLFVSCVGTRWFREDEMGIENDASETARVGLRGSRGRRYAPPTLQRHG